MTLWFPSAGSTPPARTSCAVQCGKETVARSVPGAGRTTRLCDLLTALSQIEGIERLKFVTNYPKDMTDELLQAVRNPQNRRSAEQFGQNGEQVPSQPTTAAGP